MIAKGRAVGVSRDTIAAVNRFLVLFIALLTLAMSPWATAASAKKVQSQVSLTLGPDVGLFRGSVSSNSAACIRHRKVYIVRAESGDAVGSDRANSSGRFRVQSQEQSGSWFARVKPKRIGGQFCKGDKSSVQSAG